MSDKELVRRWLAERQHLLVELVGISRGLRSRTPNTEGLRVRIRMFCDRLVDYVSAGHFEVYADLATAPETARLLGRLWTQLERTTAKVLGFNERVGRKQWEPRQIGTALAEMSLALEDRFTIEDRLIATATAAGIVQSTTHLLARTQPSSGVRQATNAAISNRIGSRHAGRSATPSTVHATTVRRPGRSTAVASA